MKKNRRRQLKQGLGYAFRHQQPCQAFRGLSGTINCIILKRLSLTREEHLYEQILSYSSTMPLMLWKEEGRHSASGGKSVNLTGKVPD
jgi:hypothetical protein